MPVLLPPADERRARQATLGQFLTPPSVADFMASLFAGLPGDIRLIDAGAGVGALTAAVVRRACAGISKVRSIHASAWELDEQILPRLRETFDECEARCSERGIAFTGVIQTGDFVAGMAPKLADDLFGEPAPSYNLAIANPPYKKIGAGSPERWALRAAGLETSNLYAGFVGLLARLLESGGQLVAITPRSFCNGPYFRPFREDFLRRMSLRRLHVFDSRRAAFRQDAVLQENIIFHAVRSPAKNAWVTVSSSSGEAGAPVVVRDHPFGDIVSAGDPARVIHVPSDPGHADAKSDLAALPASLASLGVQVSTGRVVDFRLRDALRAEPGLGTAPLLYPCHFNGGAVRWPRRDARKPNAILDNAQTRPWLVPSGLYLLTKRFTSKEERRRLVACLFDPADVPGEWLGFENHLNYFHAKGRGLERNLALGLWAFLNSTRVDQWFRCFSGHTQVNATDLRGLAYPDRPTLEALGVALGQPNASQEELDRLVELHLHGLPKAPPKE